MSDGGDEYGREQLNGTVLCVEFQGGAHDGMRMTHVVDEVSGTGYFTCDNLPGKYRQVFVPLEMEHSDFLG